MGHHERRVTGAYYMILISTDHLSMNDRSTGLVWYMYCMVDRQVDRLSARFKCSNKWNVLPSFLSSFLPSYVRMSLSMDWMMLMDHPVPSVVCSSVCWCSSDHIWKRTLSIQRFKGGREGGGRIRSQHTCIRSSARMYPIKYTQPVQWTWSIEE